MDVLHVTFVGCFAALLWLHVIFFERSHAWLRRVLDGWFVRPSRAQVQVAKVLATAFATLVTILFLVMLVLSRTHASGA
jgi:hypothetical protein